MESLAAAVILILLSMLIASGIAIALAIMGWHYSGLLLGLLVFIAAISISQGSLRMWPLWVPPVIAMLVSAVCMQRSRN